MELRTILRQDSPAAAFWETAQTRRAQDRQRAVQEAAACGGPTARKLLCAALWDEKREVVLAAVAALRDRGDAGAILPLEWLSELSRVAAVAEAAGAAAAELRAGGKAGPAADSGGEYWASFIDGDGAQLLMAIHPAPRAAAGRFRVASVAINDQRGVMDASGMDATSGSEAAELRDTGSRRRGAGAVHGDAAARGGSDPAGRGVGKAASDAPEIGWVRVDGAYCAAAIDEVYEIHRRDRRRLPAAWEFWRDDFRGEEATAVPAPHDHGLPAGLLQRRLRQTATLIHFEGFRSWLIQGEDLVPFLPAALKALKTRGAAREAGLAEAISSCLACVIRARQKRLWRARLLRQSALWERRGDGIVRELCLAAAWGLDSRNKVPPEQHPLLRAMTRASLEAVIGF